MSAPGKLLRAISAVTIATILAPTASLPAIAKPKQHGHHASKYVRNHTGNRTTLAGIPFVGKTEDQPEDKDAEKLSKKERKAKRKKEKLEEESREVADDKQEKGEPAEVKSTPAAGPDTPAQTSAASTSGPDAATSNSTDPTDPTSATNTAGPPTTATTTTPPTTTTTATTTTVRGFVPSYIPDSALVSILTDLSRVLTSSEPVKVDDENGKLIVKIAGEILTKSLRENELNADRIVHRSGTSAQPMTIEAWSSGDVKLDTQSHGSVAVVWAKCENGLLNLTIAGNCPERSVSGGKKIGEFVVFATATSAIKKGFDIQTQSEVNFWLGKISSLQIAADCCAENSKNKEKNKDEEKDSEKAQSESNLHTGATEEAAAKKPLAPLPTLLTERGREYLAQLAALKDKQGLCTAGAQFEALKREPSPREEITSTSSSTSIASGQSSGVTISNSQLSESPAAGVSPAADVQNSASIQTTTASSTPTEATTVASASGPPNASSTSSASNPSNVPAVPGASNSTAQPSSLRSKGSNESEAQHKPVQERQGKESATPTVTTVDTTGSKPAAGSTSSSVVSISTTSQASSPNTSAVVSDTALSPTALASSSNSIASGSDSTGVRSWSDPAPQATNVSTSPKQSVVSANQIATTGSDKEATLLGSPNKGLPPKDHQSAKPSKSNSQQVKSSSRSWESPAPMEENRIPSSSARVMFPQRAVAGQFLTSAVIDGSSNPESAIELVFNGASVATDKKGQSIFMVPEDATPGRSLNITMPSRPEGAPCVVDILQPLTLSTQQDTPKVDWLSPLVKSDKVLVINGHNFDGLAEHNRILVDGTYEGHILASSPVQLKVLLPEVIEPGTHSATVTAHGLHSTPAQFEVVEAKVQADAKELSKDILTKLIVRVRGTNNRVQVHLINQTPDVIKITKGNDIRFTMPGGTNNMVVLGVQRLRKGNYHVDSRIE